MRFNEVGNKSIDQFRSSKRLGQFMGKNGPRAGAELEQSITILIEDRRYGVSAELRFQSFNHGNAGKRCVGPVGEVLDLKV